MKAYTNIEQSKKLAEMLPIESADMVLVDYGYCKRILPKDDVDATTYPIITSAWSLAALLDYLKSKSILEIEVADSFRIETDYYDEEEGKIVHPIHSIMYESEDFVDACYEMILELHKEGLL